MKNVDFGEKEPIINKVEIPENKDMTILDALAILNEKSQGRQIDDAFREENAAALQKIKDNFPVDDMQACMMAVILEEEECNTKEIAEHFSLSNIQLMKEIGRLREMVVQGILASRGKNVFRPTSFFLKAAMENQPMERPKMDNLTYEEFFKRLALIFKQQSNSRVEEEVNIMYQAIDQLIDMNPQLELARQVAQYELEDREKAILLYACTEGSFFNNWYVNCHELEELWRCQPFTFQICMQKLQSGESDLILLDLIGPTFMEGMANFNVITLTPKAKKELLSDTGLNFEEDKERFSRWLTSYQNIDRKELYYNPVETASVYTLTQLLQPERFKDIRQRMKDHGLNSSFCILFYGDPGTGKTETALQLARTTGRDIYQINANDFQDKFVGESERKIKEIFRLYNEMAEKLDVEPIFLLNECDAVLGKRREVRNSVDQHDVNISNIILQEMEKINGIILATTNLTKNLDPAMDRRFLYKVKFTKPSLNVKKKIWMSMLPGLKEEDAAQLAADYDFSPGQIMNCCRKHVVQNVLFNSPLDYEHMKTYCSNEVLERGQTRNKIGF